MQKNVDILRGEFIGKQVRVQSKGVEGKIIDETKNSFLIKTKTDVTKRLLKANSIFQLKIDKNFVPIEGNLVLMRPEDRIKIRKWK